MRCLRVLFVLALFYPVPITAQTQLSEIRIDQPGADTDEYFEISGPVGQDLSTLTYVVIGDGAAGSGVIESVTSIGSLAIPQDGYFLAAESGFSLGPTPDMETSLNFENGDNVTHMLVTNFSGTTGLDLDTEDDGILDDAPWSEVVDCVALLESETGGDHVYCENTVGPNGGVPWHVYRDAGWQVGDNDPSAGEDTPGEAVSALPVELGHFAAVLEPGSVRFTWTTLSERDNIGFRIYRQSEGSIEPSGFIPSTGGATGASYDAVLPKPPPGTHKYRLIQYDVDGSAHNVSTLTVTIPTPGEMAVSGPYPNPANSQVRMSIVSRRAAMVTISLTDMLGRKGQNVFSGNLGPGDTQAILFSVAGLAPGQYFLRIRSGNRHSTRPLMVVGSRG